VGDAATPLVAVLATGGTIAMAADGAGSWHVVPKLTAAELAAAIPGLAGAALSVTVRDVRQVPGAAVTMADLYEVADRAGQEAAAGAAGVVVTQGTDSIEETAYFLDLIHDQPTPLVVTGAMRNPALAGADGPANLLAAVQVAASLPARGLGCLVVMNGEVHEGRWVRKAHSIAPSAFNSPDVGPIGHVVEGEFRLLRGPTRDTRVPIREVDRGAGVQVALVTMTLGDDGELLRKIDASFAGLVVAAFGAGHVPPGVVPVLADLAARMPVVLASRTGAGPVLSRTYGFPGSESDLLDRGLVSAGFLHPLKARVLLHLLLSAHASRAEIGEAFTVAGAAR
jgi:L-asparaginase